MKLALLISLLLTSACAPVIHGVHAIQPSQTVDTPAVWVEIKTDDEKLNGVYRCVDDGKMQPVCKRAGLVQ